MLRVTHSKVRLSIQNNLLTRRHQQRHLRQTVLHNVYLRLHCHSAIDNRVSLRLAQRVRYCHNLILALLIIINNNNRTKSSILILRLSVMQRSHRVIAISSTWILQRTRRRILANLFTKRETMSRLVSRYITRHRTLRRLHRSHLLLIRINGRSPRLLTVLQRVLHLTAIRIITE